MNADPSKPIEAKQLRPWQLRASDPLAVALSTVVTLLGLFGLWTWLGWDANRVAELLGGLMVLAGLARWYLERRADDSSSTTLQQREGKLYREALNRPQPKRVQRVGADGEGGALVLHSSDEGDDELGPEDRTPVRPVGPDDLKGA